MKSTNSNCWKLKNSKCTYGQQALYSCKVFPKRNALGVIRVSLTSALLKGLFEIEILYSYVGSYSLLHDVWQVYTCTVKSCSPTKKVPPPPLPRHPHLTWPVVSMAHCGGHVRVNSDIGQQKCGETIQTWVETVTATKKIPNTFMIK